MELQSDVGFLGFLGLGDFSVSGEVVSVFDKDDIRKHFENLCAKVGVECKEHLSRAQAATQIRDWDVAYSEWSSCRDAILCSEGLLDRDDRPWLLGCQALVLANLSAFHSMNFGRALTHAIAASKARDEVQNVLEALDFKSYVEPTLLKVMYLWAEGCDEEGLDPDVKAFVIDALRDSVSDSEVSRTLKQQCKDFVLDKSESVIWEVQKCFSRREERLRWARKGNKVYKEKYPGKVDYVSKANEAYTLFLPGTFEEASKVFEEISDSLDLEPWKANVREVDPAARYCTLEYAFFIHQLLCTCYNQMALFQPCGEKDYIGLVGQETERFQSLWTQIQLQNENEFSSARERLAEAMKYAPNKWEERYEKCFGTSQGQSIWDHLDELRFLNEYHTFFKTQYRQSYESGLPDESHFSNAESCATKLLDPDFKSLFSLSHVQSSTFVKLVRLHHEKDRQVMFLKRSSNMVDVNPEETPPILHFAKKAIKYYVERLIQQTNRDDYWIIAQEFHKDVYYMLQFHNFAVWIANHGCTLDSTCDMEFPDRLQDLWNRSLRPEGAIAESSLPQEIWKQSLIWAEWRLAKIIYFQLPPNRSSASAMEQLGEFDLKDDVAWNTLKSSRASCGPGTVVLEYFLSEGNDLQFIYVMTKEDEVFMQILKIYEFEEILRDTLELLRELFKRYSEVSTEDERITVETVDGLLETLYEIFISPVENLLDDMEEEDKLIFVAPEILSDIPFAALRKPNSPVGEGYLIQSHTISVTPSLRMLEHCNQRLKKLDQNGELVTKPGTIVVVGDPTDDLKGSGEEVNSIEELFGKEHVKKLVGAEATPSEVLKWAKYPSENRVKQVVFHIAAHAIAQDDGEKVRKGAIILAGPASSCQQNNGTARQGAMLRAQDDEALDYENYDELGDCMVDVNEESQISSHGEEGGIRTISKQPGVKLKSEDISECGFPWEAHMVVLSGCETARGKITGEGVLNLPRALMIAGIPCVVVSQWKVDDLSTPKLMKGFYGELRSGKDVSSSLRAAMLKMMKDKGKVHEWAPFVVYGLPTVCLPTELQAGTSSCKGQDCGTRSDLS